MKLIIDISDKTYEIIKNMVYFYNPQRSGRGETKEIFNAIKQGIPLPKGHGRLIDADTLYREIETEGWFDSDDEYYGGGLEDIVLNAPTIIEADRG